MQQQLYRSSGRCSATSLLAIWLTMNHSTPLCTTLQPRSTPKCILPICARGGAARACLCVCVGGGGGGRVVWVWRRRLVPPHACAPSASPTASAQHSAPASAGTRARAGRRARRQSRGRLGSWRASGAAGWPWSSAGWRGCRCQALCACVCGGGGRWGGVCVAAAAHKTEEGVSHACVRAAAAPDTCGSDRAVCKGGGHTHARTHTLHDAPSSSGGSSSKLG
jgi:hypothetical protein